jgi:hypothetical protein
MPIKEKIGFKKVTFSKGLREANRIILLMGVKQGLIKVPYIVEGLAPVNSQGDTSSDITAGDASATASSGDSNAVATEGQTITDLSKIRRIFYDTSIQFSDAMPKDKVLELEQLQQEITLGLENRRGAMKRLGHENVEQKLTEVDKDADDDTDKEIKRQKKFVDAGVEPSAKQPLQPQKKINSGFNNGPEPKKKPQQ